MGGEPGTTLLQLPGMPNGYRVTRVGHRLNVEHRPRYWWEGPNDTFGGPFDDRWQARRAAVAASKTE